MGHAGSSGVSLHRRGLDDPLLACCIGALQHNSGDNPPTAFWAGHNSTASGGATIGVFTFPAADFSEVATNADDPSRGSVSPGNLMGRRCCRGLWNRRTLPIIRVNRTHRRSAIPLRSVCITLAAWKQLLCANVLGCALAIER
jgi:hypothetical protein